MEAKKILKTGDVVELRNGDRFITIKDIENVEDFAFNPKLNEHISIGSRNDNLESNYGYRGYDVVKIYRPLYDYSLKFFDQVETKNDYFNLIWEENEIEVGDKVKVVNPDLAHITDIKFLWDYPNLLGRFVYGEKIPEFDTYTVVMKNKHKMTGEILCCIQNINNQIFIIEETGVEKYEQVIDSNGN